jgi:hypothetical protein
LWRKCSRFYATTTCATRLHNLSEMCAVLTRCVLAGI